MSPISRQCKSSMRSNSPSTKSIKKAVQFCANEIQLFEPQGQAAQLYYSKDQYVLMRLDNDTAAADARKRLFQLQFSSTDPNSTEDDLEIDLNGIEHLVTPSIIDEVINSKIKCQCAVLQEQARQVKAGENDPDRIARASLIHSKWATKRALKIGLQHARSSGRVTKSSQCSTRKGLSTRRTRKFGRKR